MKNAFLIFAICFITNVSAQTNSENLVSANSFDKVTKTSTYQQLKTLYGAKNLKDEMAYAPEGLDSFIVTKIFKGTKKEFNVQWEEKQFHKQVSSVETYTTGSPYHTIDGIRVGTTLDKLVLINGMRIDFFGTGWDFGGLIISFNKGRLDKSPLFLQLAGTENVPETLLGDSEFHTDMPLVKKHLKKHYVSKMSVTFSK